MLECSYTLPPTPDYPLYITAKRYWMPNFESNKDDDAAQTLIVLHSTSFHKETWEPTLQDLFKLVLSQQQQQQQENTGSATHLKSVLIRDAWAIDCPNHGRSAVLNHRVLEDPKSTNFSCERYAYAVHKFLSSGPDGGVPVDFQSRNLVGLGHSLGANAMLMLQHIQPTFNFSKLIIVEPMTSPQGSHHLDQLQSKLVSNASRRQNIWPSLQVANTSLMMGRNKQKWDTRVLQTYIKHAIYWNPQTKVFTLCCSPEQEIVMYMDVDGSTKPIDHLNNICHRIPIHVILGQIPDLIPAHVHKALVDPNSGRQYASISWVPGIGHLLPQEAPTTLASLIYDALSSEAVPVPIQSKL